METILGFILALLLAEEFRGRKFFRTIIMMPLILTPVAFSFGWRMMYHPNIGVINFFLNKFGIASVNWLANPYLAMISLIIIDVWQCTPFMMLIILAGITSLPVEPFEAAKVDGATGIQMFWRVTIPLLKPVFIIAILFRALDAFKTFDIFMTMTGGGPGASTEVLNLYTYLNSFRFLNIGYASALAVLMLLISFALGIILIRIGDYK
ncbi:MAG: carbohydrate ABC transporter permease [Bacillota bacterium]